MFTKHEVGLALIWVAVLPFSFGNQAADPKLSILNPLLNKNWKGTMKSVDGSPDWVVVCRFESVPGGKLVRYRRSSPTRRDFEEGYLYWDDIARRIAFFIIHSGGAFRTGFATADNSTITFQGRMTWPTPPPDARVKQAYDFRNTFEFASQSVMTDRWFQNAFGEWRPGHVIEFRSPEK